MNSSARSLFAGGVLALMLTRCGTASEHSSFVPGARGVGGAGASAGTAGVIQLGEAGDSARTSAVGTCAIGAIAEFETCADDARDGSPCDGLALACALAGDAGASGVLLCATGVYPSVWNETVELTSPCDERAVGTCPSERASGMGTADDLVRDISGQCLGDESSMTVLFDHGCPRYVVSSAHLPDQKSCVMTELDGKRYPCLSAATCGRAQHSTLP